MISIPLTCWILPLSSCIPNWCSQHQKIVLCLTLETCQKNFWDAKETEYVEELPYFVVIFRDKKLMGIAPLRRHFLKKKVLVFPMAWWARTMVEIAQFLFHCCCYIFKENAVFLIMFWSRISSKKQKLGNIFWCNKWNGKNIIPTLFLLWKIWWNISFGLFCGSCIQEIIRKLGGI